MKFGSRPVKTRLFLSIGAVISLTVYLLFFIDQLSIHHDCTPTDGLCNSGNTVLGDAYWAFLLSVMVLVPMWVVGVLVYKTVGYIYKSTDGK